MSGVERPVTIAPGSDAEKIGSVRAKALDYICKLLVESHDETAALDLARLRQHVEIVAATDLALAHLSKPAAR
jgi:hypothetical protein